MDGALKKIGIYDFMGIWGPGAITVAYYSFSLGSPIKEFLCKFNIVQFNLSEKYTLLLLYTAIAYIVGIVLHEVGKLLKIIIDKLWPERKSKYNDDKFGNAARYLKYTQGIDTHQYDTYHSVYALARSMCISFVVHIVILFICLFTNYINVYTFIFFSYLDKFLAILFFCRTYKYYKMWIKHTFLQYEFHKKQKEGTT